MDWTYRVSTLYFSLECLGEPARKEPSTENCTRTDRVERDALVGVSAQLMPFYFLIRVKVKVGCWGTWRRSCVRWECISNSGPCRHQQTL